MFFKSKNSNKVRETEQDRQLRCEKTDDDEILHKTMDYPVQDRNKNLKKNLQDTVHIIIYRNVSSVHTFI